MRHPDPETNRQLERVYQNLPRFRQIVWDAEGDVHRNDQSPDWSPYKLPEHLFTVWAVSAVQDTTNNGGFQYFFENDWPGCPSYQVFIDALERIGASECADLLKTAEGAFPFREPHLDLERRREFLESSRSTPDEYDSLIDRCGQRMMDLSDELEELMSKYILLHISSFPAVKEKS